MHTGRNSPFGTIVATILFIFLLIPVLLVFPMSFSNDAFLTFPPHTWGGRYYVELARNWSLMQALKTSVLLACGVTLLSLSIAVPAAYTLVRHDFSGREILMGIFTAPLLIPSIVLGLAMLLVFVRLNLLATYTGLVLAHLVLSLPYALRVLATSLATLPPSIEEAASTLGASPLAVFRRVTLPLIMPGIIAAASLSFLVSFDEVVISLFVVGPQLTTFPVELYRYVETRTDPMAAAASVVLIVATLVLVLVLERTMGIARALGSSEEGHKA
jgi:putative spermidine/putrescine transport system permease protein